MEYKTALVHEWLTTLAGSEKVLEEIYGLYNAPIYTLVVDKKNLVDTVFAKADITTSFIQSLPFSKKKYRSYLPLFPMAIEDFDLSEYDIILSTSHSVAKGILKRSDQLHITYSCTPMRYIWDVYHQYMKAAGLRKGLKGFFSKIISNYLRIWDVISSNRVDYFIADSKYIAGRIKSIYRREAEVIYPPVDLDSFNFCEEKDDYFLAASRMVPYKMMDIIVEAFTAMGDKKLVVIGDGPDMKKIKRIAGKSRNIEIIGYQSTENMSRYMMKARAFVFAALEDFGIMPVEAQACGTPVIAYGRGGALETVVKDRTGLFFYEQTPGAIVEAVKLFEKKNNSFNPKTIQKNSSRFSKINFQKKYKKYVEQCISRFYKK